MVQSRRTASRAITLVELLVASAIMLILLMAMMPLLSASTRAWHRNSADVTATMDLTIAMRRITNELRRARSVSVNSSGTHITYVLPNGVDGVMGLVYPILRWHPAEGPVDTIDLLDGVLNVDPETGNAYPLFQLGANGRTVTVRLWVRRQTPAGVRYLRMQELVVLRNR